MGLLDDPVLQQTFAQAGQQYGVDPRVLMAMHLAETGGTGRWDRTSPAGAMGGMQLMPSTARALGVQNPYDPSQAIPGAAQGLSQLLGWAERRAGGQGWPALSMALKAYNNGPNPARWNNPETAGYPDAVLRYYQQLQQQGMPSQQPQTQPQGLLTAPQASFGGSPAPTDPNDFY